mgnify:CR=1 FL=1
MKDEQATDGYGTWIENLLPGAVFGYKYLDFSPHCTQLTMRLRGKGILTMRWIIRQAKKWCGFQLTVKRGPTVKPTSRR